MALLEIISGLMIAILILPISLSILFLNKNVRVLANIYLSAKYRGKIFLMESLDPVLSLNSIGNTPTHTTLFILKGECSLNKLREKFSWILSQKLENTDTFVYKKLNYKCVTKLGYLCWEDVGNKFSISEHVKYINGNPGVEFTEEELLIEIEKFIDHPLSEYKPQWEVLVIPHIKKEENAKENYYGLLFRVHHGIMDGISISLFFTQYFIDNPITLPINPFQIHQQQKSVYKNFGKILKCCLLGPSILLKQLEIIEENCFHGPELTGPKHLKVSRKISLNALKIIKKYTKSSIPSILISCLAGALNTLAKKKGTKLPNTIHAISVLGILPLKDALPKNQFAGIVIPTVLGSPPLIVNHLDRLEQISYSLKKNLQEKALVNYYMAKIVGMFPKVILEYIFTDGAMATMSVTNIVGTEEKLTICGHELLYGVTWPPLAAKVGIGLTSVSYMGSVRAGIIVDTTACPEKDDVTLLTEAFEAEIAKLGLSANVLPEDLFSTSES